MIVAGVSPGTVSPPAYWYKLERAGSGPPAGLACGICADQYSRAHPLRVRGSVCYDQGLSEIPSSHRAVNK